MGARMNTIQQVQRVNFEKNIKHVVCVLKPGKYYESNKISLVQAAREGSPFVSTCLQI